jgi:hypothetical protein
MSQVQSRLGAALAVLGLAEGADRGAVTRAYRRLARLTHPDRSEAPDAAARFAAITAAYHQALAATASTEPADAMSPAPAVRVRVGPARTGPLLWFAPRGAVGPLAARPFDVAPISEPPIVAGPVRVFPSRSGRETQHGADRA